MKNTRVNGIPHAAIDSLAAKNSRAVLDSHATMDPQAALAPQTGASELGGTTHGGNVGSVSPRLRHASSFSLQPATRR
jgi:hypothetical protein